MLRFTFAALFLVAACSHDAEFQIDPPAAGLPSESAISFFGVYRDGRLDADYWETLSPRISPALGGTSCPIVFEPTLAERDPALYADIDRETKENGVTKEVLARFADRASTQMVAVMQVTGRPPVPKPPAKYDDTGSAASGNGPPVGGRGGSLGGGRQQGPRPSNQSSENLTEDVQRFELVMSLYDANKKAFVSRVAMKYAGTSADEAITTFTTKVKEIMPGMKCVGWKTKPN